MSTESTTTPSNPSNPQPASIIFQMHAAPPNLGPRKLDLTETCKIDKSDLTAIAVARYEAAARSNVAAASRAHTEAASALRSIQSSITKTFEDFVLSHPTSPLSSILAAVTPFGWTGAIQASGDYSHRRPSEDNSSWSRRSDLGAWTSNPRASIQITSTLTLSNNNTFSLHQTLPIPASLADLFAQETAATASLTAAEGALVAARQQLTNIASVERSARAAIAEAALRSAGAEGAAILQGLSNVSPMALLPETRPAVNPNG